MFFCFTLVKMPTQEISSTAGNATWVSQILGFEQVILVLSLSSPILNKGNVYTVLLKVH